MIALNRRRYMGGGGAKVLPNYLAFTAIESGTFSYPKALQYSLDGGNTWVSLAANTATPTVGVGEKIMWKGSYTPGNAQNSFTSTGQFTAEGDPRSIVYGDSFETATLGSYAMYRMFSGCTKLTSVKNLVITGEFASYAVNACRRMFEGCTSLVELMDELPILTLRQACYQNMFEGCTSLTSCPSLPSTSLATDCYSRMFYNCSSLVTPMQTLPATILANSCYNNMFRGCSKLVSTPVLPAIDLVSGCYNHMFRYCSSVNYIKAMFKTEPSTTYTDNWVNGVAATGTFVKNSEATWTTTGVSGVPDGWTIVPDIIMTTATNPEVLAICYAQGWCADSSKMTAYEAAAVTSIGDVFKANKSITHFEEFAYFTSVTNLVNDAFRNCSNLVNISLPYGMTTLGTYVFYNCTKLTTVDIPSTVNTFGEGDFYNSGITSITIPVGVTVIPNHFCRSSKITELIVPEGVTTLGTNSFHSCGSLASATLPSTITTMYGYLLYNCSSLTSLTVKASSPPSLGGNALTNTSANLAIYVPSGSVSTYQGTSGWSAYASRIQAIPT